MTSRFTCFKCGTEINPESKFALRYVRGWARATGKTMVIIEQEDHKFVHEVCLSIAEHKEDQLPLF